MDQELELCRIALKERQADAWERVERCRQKIIVELAKLKEVEDAAKDPKRKRTQLYLDDLTKKLHARAEPHLSRLAILDEMCATYGGRTMDRQGGSTAEQLLLEQMGRYFRGDPLIRLMAGKHLSIEHVMIAREISRIIEHIGHRSMAKTANYPVASGPDPENRGRSERQGDAIDYAEYMSILHAKVYMPWSDGQRKEHRVSLVLGLCVEGRSVEELRRAYHLNWETVMKRVREALDQYAIYREKWARGSPEPRCLSGRADFARPPATSQT